MEVLVGWARRIAGGDLLARGTGPFWWAPLYPFMMGGVFALLGPDNLAGAALAQAGLGAGTCVLVYRLGRRLMGDGVGLTAGFLAAVYGPLIFYTGVFLSATLEVFLAVAMLLTLTLARERPRPARWALAGGVTGLACLARPNFLLAAVVLAALAPLLVCPPGERLRWRHGLHLALAFALGAVFVIAPVCLRNWSVGGQLVLISAAGPETFRIGNSYDSTPLNFVYPKAPRMPVASTAFWRHQARKAVLFWWGFEAPQNINYYLARELSPTLRLPWLAFWAAVPLATLGLWVTRDRRYALLHVLAFLLSYYASVVAFFVIARWRLPLVAPLLVFSAAGLHVLAGWVWTRRWRAVGAALIVILLLAGSIFPWRTERILPADHGQLGYILANRGAYEEAARRLQAAARGLPYHGPLHRDLGILLMRVHRLPEARAALERAVRLLPQDAAAHYHLGRILAPLESSRARLHLARAVALAPDADFAAEGRRMLDALERGVATP